MPEETQMDKTEDKNVNFNDFSSILGDNSITTEEPEKIETEVPKDDSPILEEEKPDDEPREPLPGTPEHEEVVEKETVKSETPTGKVKKSRDMTGIDEAHHNLFRNMSGEAFDLAKEKYLENKRLKEEVESFKKAPKPTSVIGHERAYTLDPKYTELVSNVQGADIVQRHWQTQLAKIRRGEKWQDLDIDKNGKFIISELKDSTAEDESNVITWLEEATGQKRRTVSEYQEFIGGYEKSFKSDLEVLNNGIKQFFPDAEKPEMKKMEQEVINKFIPLSFRDHPVTRLWAHTVYEIAKRDKEIAELKKNGGRAAAIAKTAADAPPTKKAMGAGASNGSSNGITFDAFNKVLQQR
jgi:hypothetical protein